MSKREVVFWSTDSQAEYLHHTTKADAIQEYVDELAADEVPDKVTVYGYARMPVSAPGYAADYALENLLESLDEDYGGEDPSESTPTMKAAAEAFVEAVVKEYQATSWACELVEEEEIDLRFDL